MPDIKIARRLRPTGFFFSPKEETIMQYTLVIAEKKSVAQSLSAVLGANERKGGYFIGSGYIVSYCAGHLLELAPPNAYNEGFAKWRYADLPIIPSEWHYIPSKGKEAQLKILKELLNRPDVDTVVNACDAGREGENIFRHVYNHARCSKKILRLWIASLEPAAIKAGFDNLKDGKEYDNLYAAAYCRERADWLVGLNSTRAFSTMYNITLNVGRVQSPTLAMLVKRDADIASFVKEALYTPAIDYGAFIAYGAKSKDKQAVEEIRVTCTGKAAVVRTIESQKKTITPPKLYDLTALQRDANLILGFTAKQTLEYAQSLYEKAILSYPRVDSRYLTSDMRGTVQALVPLVQKVMPFNIESDFTPDISRLINDNRVSDHHAIIPTSKIANADISALPSGERDVVYLVTTRLLCAVAPVHSYEATTVTIDCSGHLFTANGKTIVTHGWKSIEASYKASLKSKLNNDDNSDNNEDTTSLPVLVEGQTFDNATITIKEGTTTAPRHHTEATILASMETAGKDDMPADAEKSFPHTKRKGLGTPATRAAIIEKLVKSGFADRQKKNLIPTDKGKSLIAALPETLTSPILTAEWEHRLKQVEHGELAASEFMREIEDFTKAIIKENSTPKADLLEQFSNKSNRPKTDTKSLSLGVCLRCGASVREAPRGYFCDTPSCGFKLWKASKFWTAKKKPLTAAIVTALLKDKCVMVEGLYSERTGKTYAATVILDDTGDGYVNFKLSFDRHKAREESK